MPDFEHEPMGPEKPVDPQRYNPKSYPARRIGGTMNRPALFSFFCGVLACVPFSGPIAIVLGILGYREGRKPHVGGTGFATLGVVFGIFGTIFWIAMGTILVKDVMIEKPMQAIVLRFNSALHRGNLPAARSLCTPRVTDAQLQAVIARAQKWGRFEGTNIPALRWVTFHKKDCWRMEGVNKYSHTYKLYTLYARAGHDGRYKIMQFSFGKPTPAEIHTLEP